MATLAKTQRILRDDYVNVRWPQRSRKLDGWIGDSAHEASGPPEKGGSDHNPNKRGMVNAIDVDRYGIHVPTVIAAMLRHPSTKYVIFNRRILSSTYGFRPRAYTGKNPHTKHIHRSIFQSPTAENRVTRYKFILPGELDWAQLDTGDSGEQVGDLQAYLNGWGYTLTVDGRFGVKTEKAVRSFQAAQRIAVDGIVGPQTRAKLKPLT